MPRTAACSEITISNIRLAVRQAVAEFCTDPERTVETIVNAQFENLVEPIQRLIAARLGSIYEQLQCSVLSPSNEAPLSVLRFLSEYNDESEKDIVRRLEKGSTSSRRYILGQRQKFRTPSQIPINLTPPAVDVPRLENFTSSSPSSNNASDKSGELAKNIQNSNSFFSSKSISITPNSLSFSNDNSLLEPVQESKRERQGLFSSERKKNVTLPCNITGEIHQHMRSNGDVNTNGEILMEYKKVTDNSPPVVLEKERIPTVPSVEATMYPTSANEKSKVLTMDAAVLTGHVFMNNQSVKKTEIGVNTILEMGGSIEDGCSSSHTTPDSAGQLPKLLFDTVLQRPSLKIVSLRPDGSIVPAVNLDSQRFSNVREWTPIATEGNVQKSPPTLEAESEVYSVTRNSNFSHLENSGVEELESVSASLSRYDPVEEDSCTVANIAPLSDS